MRYLAILLLVVACRREEPKQTETAQPLEPSGDPVAKVDPLDDEELDVTDELPPSLYEGSREKKPKKKSKGDKKDAPAEGDEPVAPATEPPQPAPPSEPAPSEPTPASPPLDKPAAIDKPLTKEPPMPKSSARKLAAINGALCVTTGAAKIGAKVEKAAMRAVAKGTEGDAAAMTFTYHGETATTKKLASGTVRRQLGLKLRAENGCNLIYVMWRLDPKPMVYVQTKRNPGAKDHKACGPKGYKKVTPVESKDPPELRFGEKHELRAEIENDELRVFIDDTLHWRGKLPEDARSLRGPAGMRSDNLAFDLISFAAPNTGARLGNAKCVSEDAD